MLEAIAIAAALGWWILTRNSLLEVSPLPQAVTVSYAWSVMAREEKINAFCHAIAFAEGYEDASGNPQPQNLAFRCNNPGDIKWTPSQFMAHVVGKTPNGILIFDSAEIGWLALRHQVALMLDGRSSVYELGDSIIDVGQKYASEYSGDVGGGNWSRNVAAALGVDPSVTLAELANG